MESGGSIGVDGMLGVESLPHLQGRQNEMPMRWKKGKLRAWGKSNSSQTAMSDAGTLLTMTGVVNQVCWSRVV